MDIINEFINLPSTVDFEDINFELQLIKNSSIEVRLVYSINYVEPTSPHLIDIKKTGSFYNSILNGQKTFLFMYENIFSDKDLIIAIYECKKFLLQHKIIKPDIGS